MTAYLLVASLIFLAALLVATRAQGAAAPNIKVRTSEAIVATRNCDAKVPRDTPRAYSPWKPHSESFRRWQLNFWTLRLNECRAILKRRAYEWNWQAWLPEHGRRLAVCEQGLDWFATGHTQDGTFVSAFSISVNEYDRDAALMGVRPYYVKGKGVPSPWEQWQAAKGHYKRFGDGWTGNCHGIMHG